MTGENYTDTPGYHRHQCFECGFIWEHPDEVALFTKEARDEAHTCEACGEPDNHWRYSGESPPDPRPRTGNVASHTTRRS